MFTRITTTGLPGDESPITLDPKGVTVITGPSGTGKTTRHLRAVCFVLWGTDERGDAFSAAVYGGKVSASLTSTTGTVITRSKTPSGSQTRTIEKDGITADCRTESDFRAALGKLGHDAARFIVAPMAWQKLANGPGDGRPLRDLLSGLLPPVDVRAIVRETFPELTDADTIDTKQAERDRTTANRVAGEAAGAATARAEAVDELATPIEGPDADAIEAATETVRALDAWNGHRDALKTAERHNANVATAQAARDAYAAKLAELGDRPDDGAENLAAADAAANKAANEARDTHAALSDAFDARDAAHAEVARLESLAPPVAPLTIANEQRNVDAAARALADLGDSTTCPTCSRDGWDAAQDARDVAAATLADAEARLATAKAEHTAALDKHEADRARLLTAARTALDAALAAASEADRLNNEADARFKGAEAARYGAMEQGAAARAWDSARKMLGNAPEAPGDLATTPEPPTDLEPTTEAFAEAQRVLAAAVEAEAARKFRAGAQAEAGERLAAAIAARTQAEAAAKRADRLVEAVRSAPSEAARRQMAALGDTGPVALKFPEGGGCEVRIFGRPWQMASAGELVMADVWLRAGFRRALGAEWMPLVVDNRQAWSGELPDVTPRVELRTVEATVADVVDIRAQELALAGGE